MPIWQGICNRKWHHVNHHLYPDDPKRLFAGGNGLRGDCSWETTYQASLRDSLSGLAVTGFGPGGAPAAAVAGGYTGVHILSFLPHTCRTVSTTLPGGMYCSAVTWEPPASSTHQPQHNRGSLQQGIATPANGHLDLEGSCNTYTSGQDARTPNPCPRIIAGVTDGSVWHVNVSVDHSNKVASGGNQKGGHGLAPGQIGPAEHHHHHHHHHQQQQQQQQQHLHHNDYRHSYKLEVGDCLQLPIGVPVGDLVVLPSTRQIDDEHVVRSENAHHHHHHQDQGPGSLHAATGNAPDLHSAWYQQHPPHSSQQAPAISFHGAVEAAAAAAALAAGAGSAGRVAVLHDSLLLGEHAVAQGATSSVRLIDIATHQLLARCSDTLESYQLCAMSPRLSSGPSTSSASAHELVVGSVSGHGCRSCWEEGTPSLCWHKHRAQVAALCVLDARVEGLMAQRYSLHHRSLFPRITTAREHFVFTSHAEAPLVAWDLRAMGHGPLYSQDRLDHMSQGPLGAATAKPQHQALWISASDDLLLGRAANGCVWTWDLAATLGWADGSTMGAWEVMEQCSGWDGWEINPSAWPTCWGAIPLPNNSPAPAAVALVPDSQPPSFLAVTHGTGLQPMSHSTVAPGASGRASDAAAPAGARQAHPGGDSSSAQRQLQQEESGGGSGGSRDVQSGAEKDTEDNGDDMGEDADEDGEMTEVGLQQCQKEDKQVEQQHQERAGGKQQGNQRQPCGSAQEQSTAEVDTSGAMGVPEAGGTGGEGGLEPSVAASDAYQEEGQPYDEEGPDTLPDLLVCMVLTRIS